MYFEGDRVGIRRCAGDVMKLKCIEKLTQKKDVFL